MQPPAITTRTSKARAWSLPRCIVDEGILEQGQEDEGHAEVGPDVDRLRVGDRRQRIVNRRCRRAHRQQRGHCQCHSSRSLQSNHLNGCLNAFLRLRQITVCSLIIIQRSLQKNIMGFLSSCQEGAVSNTRHITTHPLREFVIKIGKRKRVFKHAIYVNAAQNPFPIFCFSNIFWGTKAFFQFPMRGACRDTQEKLFHMERRRR